MRDILISTVGTSLIGNIINSNDESLKKFYEDNNAKGISIALSKILPDNHLCGAEINSINSIIQGKHLTERSFLYLLVSDTKEGKFIGEILKLYFLGNTNPNRFEKVDFEVVDGLTDTDVKRFRNIGLRNLVKHIANIVHRHGSYRMVINATGGYKAQISFAGMIGQAFEIPVCYLFERFSEVINLPPQPVSLDFSFWLEHAELFFDLEETIETDHEMNFTDDERFITLVENIIENKTYLYSLSTTGQLFHESFRYSFNRQSEKFLPEPSTTPIEKRKIRLEDKNSGKHKGLLNYLEKIRTAPYIKEIYTHYYNPSLTKPNRFRKSTKGIINQVEGWFCNAGALTEFDIITTAAKTIETQACMIDLQNRFLNSN